MAKEKPQNEAIVCNVNGRGICDIARKFRDRCKQLNSHEDFNQLDLGFDLPDKFLQLGGPQPTLAQLTVLACKLKMQINITHVELDTLENAESKRQAAEQAATAGK